VSQRVTGAFTIDKWEGVPGDWHGAQLQRTEAAKTFTGVAVERLDVEFDGLKGSFCLLHSATAHGDENEMNLTIIPGSGTGDLVGLTGTAKILPGHVLELEYQL
jgi:hypothetical protein